MIMTLKTEARAQGGCRASEKKNNQIDQVKENEMSMACSTYGEKRNVWGILVGKLEGKRPLGRPRRRWMDNIKMELIEVGCGGMDWIDLVQDRDQWRALVNTVIKCWEVLE
jgi:hypothetical protein